MLAWDALKNLFHPGRWARKLAPCGGKGKLVPATLPTFFNTKKLPSYQSISIKQILINRQKNIFGPHTGRFIIYLFSLFL
jgi:hypothetical protein